MSDQLHFLPENDFLKRNLMDMFPGYLGDNANSFHLHWIHLPNGEGKCVIVAGTLVLRGRGVQDKPTYSCITVGREGAEQILKELVALGEAKDTLEGPDPFTKELALAITQNIRAGTTCMTCGRYSFPDPWCCLQHQKKEDNLAFDPDYEPGVGELL